MKIQTLLNEGNKQLISCSQSAKLDVEILLSEAIKKNREYLIINAEVADAHTESEGTEGDTEDPGAHSEHGHAKDDAEGAAAQDHEHEDF